MPPTSTLHDVHTLAAGPRSVLARRTGTVLLSLFVLAGALGLLGDQERTVAAEADGQRVEVRYAATARPGQDVPFEITVTDDEGLDPEVTVALRARYLNIYETQGWHPEPSEQSRDGEWLYLTFTTTGSGTLTVSYDAYIQPNRSVGEPGRLALVVDGRLVAPLEFRTVLFP